MKIIDVTEFWSERGGGVRSYLTSKAAVLARLGIEHRVLASGPRSGESTLAELGGVRSTLVRLAGPSLPYDSTYHLFMRLDAARRDVQRQLPDVLEIHSPQLAAVGALSLPATSFGIRTFVWHSDFIDTYLSWRLAKVTSPGFAGAAVAPLWTWVRQVAERCAATIAASRCQAAKLRNQGVPWVVHQPFGVDTRVFCPAAHDPGFRRSILGERDAALFVAVGRLAGEKRWDVVIDAFRRLRAKREAVLLVLGDGPERAALETRARDMPDVIFAGFDRDRARLARAVASADALLHAAPFETFGLAVAEAAACGTPVVVSARGAACELAGDGCSEVYAELDPDALAAAACRLLARDRATLRAHAQAHAARVVSLEDHFASVVELYKELLLRHGRAMRRPHQAA